MKKLALLLISSFAWASADVGQKAPEFSLKSADGKVHTLSAEKGRLVVLEWFNPHCPFIKKHYESGNMQRLQALAKAHDVDWYSIASSAKGKEGYLDPKSAAAIIKTWKMTDTTLLLDPGSSTARAYEAKTTPHIIIVDPKGTVAYNGAIDEERSAKPLNLKEYVENKRIKKYAEDAILALSAKPPRSIAETSTDPYGCSVKY